MPRVAVVRNEIQRNLKAVPFRPFALTMENGEQLIIGHPENIAFEPTSAEGRKGKLYPRDPEMVHSEEE